MKPTFFPTQAEFRTWLEAHHAGVAELWIGFYKKSSGKIAMTYAEAVDEALCFGWIDGIIKSIDTDSYMHRFTPRRPRSIWSVVNLGHVRRLTAADKMHPAGVAAHAARTAERSGVYSFEARKTLPLPPSFEKKFRANREAWVFFAAQPPGYQRAAVYKVVSPKQEATRWRWLVRLIACSAAGERLAAIIEISKPTRRTRTAAADRK